ncbi:actin cortical patch SUR7/pH-response regulator pali, partial [Lasiosphaeria miniovina]
MAQTGFFHHIGTFLLFVSTILLIIVCISAPVVHDIAILKVELGNRPTSQHATVTFGTFGWCINNVDGDTCSSSHVGYSPADVINSQDNTQFSDYARDTTRALTKAMVLHPIACGISFIAFLLALGAGVLGSFLASVVAFLAFLLTAIITIIDFVAFAVVRNNINDNGTGAAAYFSTAIWCLLAAAILLLLATIVVFLTCCSGRRHHRTAATTKTEYISPPR